MTSKDEPRTEATFVALSEAPTSLSSPKRRKRPRYKVDLDVTLASEHNFYAGFAENMSMGGIFIATHKACKSKDLVEFSIHLPNSELPVRGSGEVRWVREFSENSNVPPGAGVCFTSLAPGALEVIEDFLSSREPLFYDDEG
jgi:uncharacterized protein (TIGR02266 family)